jgi:polyketide biosynthesis 3-hydroxy-3-methylglutaryl-CoA synthase-like enzyme PksG
MTVAGIEALNIYCGLTQIPVPDLFRGRGLDLARMDHVAMEQRSIGLPCEDPVTNAVNAARPIVDALGPDRDRIEIVVASSESGIDYSKSITSYVHEYLGLSRTCRVIEAKQACYAATAALQLAVAYVASGVSPGAKVLVIATDVALVDERAGYAEPATGFGAAAMLVSDDPRVLAVDLGAFGLYAYETLDSARPGPDFDIADVDTSLFAYLDCLSHSFADYKSRVADVELGTTFDHLTLHTPFAGLVKAAHRKLMREQGLSMVDGDFVERVAPSLVYPRLVGNLCSGSVYLGLASIVDQAEVPAGRVGLFSYGSGCASEFFSGVLGTGAREALRPLDIAGRLARRTPLNFAEYQDLLAENLRCLVPARDRQVDVDRYRRYLAGAGPLLVFAGVKEYHRRYEWVEG